VLESIGASKEVRIYGLNKGSQFTQLSLMYEQKDIFHLKLLHKIKQDSLVLLEEEPLFMEKVSKGARVCFPCTEHLFEWMVLKNYLQKRGLSDEQYHYFQDFHILFKEDLLEYFNQKYGTHFQYLSQLRHFQAIAREQMVHTIRQLPTNQLIHHIHIRWNEWMRAFRSNHQ